MASKGGSVAARISRVKRHETLRGEGLVGAVILGLLSGIVGFAPLLVGLRLTKRVTATSNFGHMSILIISLIVSFVLMFALAMLCVAFARDYALPFVLAEALALSVTAIVFGIMRSKSNKEGKVS